MECSSLNVILGESLGNIPYSLIGSGTIRSTGLVRVSRYGR